MFPTHQGIRKFDCGRADVRQPQLRRRRGREDRSAWLQVVATTLSTEILIQELDPKGSHTFLARWVAPIDGLSPAHFAAILRFVLDRSPETPLIARRILPDVPPPVQAERIAACAAAAGSWSGGTRNRAISPLDLDHTPDQDKRPQFSAEDATATRFGAWAGIPIPNLDRLCYPARECSTASGTTAHRGVRPRKLREPHRDWERVG